jgi:hypothetical protein
MLHNDARHTPDVASACNQGSCYVTSTWLPLGTLRVQLNVYVLDFALINCYCDYGDCAIRATIVTSFLKFASPCVFIQFK